MTKTELKKLLLNNSQNVLADSLDALSDQEINELYLQVSKIEWDQFKQQSFNSDNKISQSKIISLLERKDKEAHYTELGVKAYQNGEVAALMVAGGQGTRLGFNGPKGCFQIGAVSKKSLYQIHAEKVLATSLRFGSQMPFLVMTSSATNDQTRDFFNKHSNFGLTSEQVKFFTQAEVPSLDLQGNLLLAKPGKLLTNPDGHGGCFTSLAKSGLLKELKNQGIKHLVYIQVDNALAPIFDPFLIGLAIEHKAQVITKVVKKCSAEEKVGLLVNINGKDTIKEYISLSKATLEEKDGSGNLKYSAGNTAMHYWSVDFLEEKSSQGFKLPLYASKKPLRVWQDKKEQIVEGNKYERFIFDLIPLANISLGLEVEREAEFAPLKNSTGADSPATVNQLCSTLFKSWIRSSGISIADSIQIEVSPLLAMDQKTMSETLGFDSQLREKIKNCSDKIYLS